MRGFEIVKDFAIKYGEKDVKMPLRATKTSAGYDFYSPIDISIPQGESEIIWTNIKAKCEDDEFLMILSTSGMGKRGLILSQGAGIIDSDYYGNESTDGNIGFRITNLGKDTYVFKKGDKIGQGIFLKYLSCDEDNCSDEIRKGGFGSTVK